MYKWIFDRILGNWKTTAKALTPAIVGLLAHYGFNISPETVTLWLSVAYIVVLAVSKDPEEVQKLLK